MNDIQRDLGRVEGKVDGLTAVLTSLQADLKSHMLNRETRDQARDARINRVENKLYWFSGATAAVTFLMVNWQSIAATLARGLPQ